MSNSIHGGTQIIFSKWSHWIKETCTLDSNKHQILDNCQKLDAYCNKTKEQNNNINYYDHQHRYSYYMAVIFFAEW